MSCFVKNLPFHDRLKTKTIRHFPPEWTSTHALLLFCSSFKYCRGIVPTSVEDWGIFCPLIPLNSNYSVSFFICEILLIFLFKIRGCYFLTYTYFEYVLNNLDNPISELLPYSKKFKNL